MAQAGRIAEVRAEDLLIDLLQAQGWDVRKPPAGEMLRQHEYKDHPHLLEILRGISKSGGPGDGRPEGFLVDRQTLQPLAVIEVKSSVDDLDQAAKEASTIYGRACIEAGYTPLAIALAGSSEDNFGVRVLKWMGTRWLPVTYEAHPIGWIPNRADIERLLVQGAPREIRPTVPPPEVLADRADEINRLLRESGIKDEYRPAVVGAIMLALWQSKGQIRKDPNHILSDINESCGRAFWKAKKHDLAKSISVDEANDDLARNARRIVTILERLNVTVLTAEHDYLGHLYEAFFRYTGGNTIGQYFTPRHICGFMANLLNVESDDIVLDPSCGTGGFLIAVMNRLSQQEHLSRAHVVNIIQERLIGFDKEPVTAALCVANMILRGDGSTGVHRGDCFTSEEYPVGSASVVLTNPPFPHAKTDTPPERFIARALDGLQQRSRLGIIVPRSLLGKPNKRKWQASVLAHHTLDAVIVLPDELFAPYASSYTAILLMTKGVKHPANHSVFFVRVENDGFRRYKNVRVHCEGEQLTLALQAFQKRETIPGFCGWTAVNEKMGWDAGFYIPARPLSDDEISAQSAALARNSAAFVVAHAPELSALDAAVNRGELKPVNYLVMKGKTESLFNGQTIGGYFDIFYGQKALHSKDALAPGPSLIISSSGIDNGCYGFFDFPDLIEAPFVTVPSTGSIGRAHVQKWPCGVTDDCLILVPKKNVPYELLYVAAAVVRQERWRFNYGRKITPERIAGFPLPTSEKIIKHVREHVDFSTKIEMLALEMAHDEQDKQIARERLAEIKSNPRLLVSGKKLKKQLDELLF